MKIYRAQLNKIAEGLYKIINENQFVESVIKHQTSFPEQGSKDRKIIAGALFEIIKSFRKYWFLSGLKSEKLIFNDFKAIVSTYFFLQGTEFGQISDWPVPDPEEMNTLLTELENFPAIKYSLPDWLYLKGLESYEDDWHNLLEISLEVAPIFIRVNTLVTTTEKLAEKFKSNKIDFQIIDDNVIQLNSRIKLSQNIQWQAGHFELQDYGSQQISLFAKPKSGFRVIDACAGAGGKSLHLAALMNNKGHLIALDIDFQSIRQLEIRVKRAGVKILEAHAFDTASGDWWPVQKADLILCDVPCSGTGVLRRETDKKRTLTIEHFTELLTIQSKILSNASNFVKAGGHIVYATCSLLPEENRHQVESFLKNHSGFSLLEEKSLLPVSGGHDGFYMAKIKCDV